MTTQRADDNPGPVDTTPSVRTRRGSFSAARRMFTRRVAVDSLLRLNPLLLKANPVMLLVEVTFFIVAAMALYPQGFPQIASAGERLFYVEVAAILLITVWFSTLSDSLAESQMRNTAGSLRKLEAEVMAKKLNPTLDPAATSRAEGAVATRSVDLRKGDLVLLEKGDTVPIDAVVLEGIAMVDESLLTGESTPVRKAPSDPLIGGSRVISDTLVAEVTVNPDETFISQMIRLVESSKRPKTPNEQAVTIVLIGLTAIFTILVAALLGLSVVLNLGADLSVLIALYVCLLPTTIGALLPAIGLSGITRLYAKKVVAKSGRSVETAGDTDTVLLDKTGTITVGNRQAVEFVPFEGHTAREVGDASFLASWHDDTPEGRSIIRLAYEMGFIPAELNDLALSEFTEFSASTRSSGVKLATGTGFLFPKGARGTSERGRFRRKRSEPEASNGHYVEEIIKGAPDSVKVSATSVPKEFDTIVDGISQSGDTPMAVARDREIIGLIRLKDVLKPGIKGRILAIRKMGIKSVMITGDQPLTAKNIAQEVGIDEFVSQAKPEDKYTLAVREQAQIRVVAMIGDGTNDAPALAVADVGLAMNTGTQAAKEAANMVDLESNPAKIIDVVLLGKQLLMTRGAVTTFSIANDVAKYFAIMPVMFATALPQLQALNILSLNLHSAVLSALIFNAIIIPLLIPLAMRGIPFKPSSTMALFLKNALIYGVGGVIVPFVGIKLIDVALGVLHI
jgi:K+-transporting ATPase ATPase B chain